MAIGGKIDHGRPSQSQLQPDTAKYIQVRPGAARLYSAEKTHYVEYLQALRGYQI